MLMYVYTCVCNNILLTHTGARHIPTFYNNYVIVDKEGKVAI